MSLFGNNPDIWWLKAVTGLKGLWQARIASPVVKTLT